MKSSKLCNRHAIMPLEKNTEKVHNRAREQRKESQREIKRRRKKADEQEAEEESEGARGSEKAKALLQRCYPPFFAF
jgi:hypothetical protein